ncbi:telomere maintenance protein PBP2 ASCRUDRAFT_17335, partial [Ascoidea rubescens DSM 1968]
SNNNNHNKEMDDDPTYVHFRMLCLVKEASLIVGKGGEKINHIKEHSNARVNVSENLKGVQERIVHVRGSAENVAKAFGLIIRAIVDEPEDIPSSPDSKQFNLKLLIAHQVIGFVIGKGGAKFREIEDKSAAKLKASETPLPFSTDRCLSVIGVADAIHIATYFVAQCIYENKKLFHKQRTVQYQPGGGSVGFNPMNQLNIPLNQLNNPLNLNNPSQNNPLNNSNHSNNNPNNFNLLSNLNPMMGTMGMMNSMNPMGYLNPSSNIRLPHNNNSHNHNQANAQTQEILIPNDHVGSIIGKGGKNIREIRDKSGAQIKISDPDLKNPTERKIILTGNYPSIQTAIYYINNRIEI